MTVRTRFAPSPTGYLHIGGVRTALFNWLYARKHGGQFILRIDDTDQGRNDPRALQPILDGFRWLGLDWDEGAEIGGPYGPYYQSERLDRYHQAVQQLLDKGLAYWDYATTDDMKSEREAQEKEKRPKLYSRRWMAETPADRARFEAEGRTGSIRIRIPREGVCRFHDHIRGDVEVAWATEQDTVIQRSDGTVTYNLANVVDDHDMKISHVIRAEEHLSNTPRQIFMLEGLGYQRPEYAHLPFVAEPGSRNKLSKRKIAQYLKNPDFKKVLDHGQLFDKNLLGLEMALEIAIRVKNLAVYGEKLSRHPDTPVRESVIRSMQNPFVRLHSRYSIGLTLTEKGTETEEAVALMQQAIIRECLNHPELLATYERRKKLLDPIRATPKPETYNPVLIDFYKESGYLPDAILNYLVLLGWSLDDKTEDFTRQQMIDLFTLERVVKAPASFDTCKLSAFQERYMHALPATEKVEGVMPYLVRAGLIPDPNLTAVQAKVTAIVEAAGPRLKVFGDILDYDDFFLTTDQLPFNEKALDKHVRKDPGAGWLGELRAIIAVAEPFDAASLKQQIEAFIQARGAKPIPVTQTLRVAVTGKEVGFGVYETIAILGRERCLARIDRARGSGG